MSSSNANRIRASLVPLLFVITAETTQGREPTAAEQLQLELINRARANPNAEVVRLSGLTPQ